MKEIMVCLLAVALICDCTIHGNIKEGKMDAVQAYVEKGGDVNKKKEPYGHTPLYVATYYGFNDIAQYLLANGADVNAQANDGTTALMCAAIYNYPELAEVLLKADADPNLKDKKGHTALFYANQYRFFKVAEHLEAAGAIAE